MTSIVCDRQLWACANEVMRQNGADAHRLVAERLGALALAVDAAGMATWKSIAAKMDALTSEPPSTH
jgi:hypothetical protein